jgi:hypothetical protein
VTDLKNVKAKSDASVVVAEAVVTALRPIVTFTFKAVGTPCLNVKVENAWLKNSNTDYAITKDQQISLQTYIKGCNFPVL